MSSYCNSVESAFRIYDWLVGAAEAVTRRKNHSGLWSAYRSLAHLFSELLFEQRQAMVKVIFITTGTTVRALMKHIDEHRVSKLILK
jgi:hypothetical protein